MKHILVSKKKNLLAGGSGIPGMMVFVLMAFGNSGSAFAELGGQEYIAVPKVYGSGSKAVRKWVYRVNKGKPYTDSDGTTYTFSNFVIKDTFYAQGRDIILKRRATITMQLSGFYVGSVSISENSLYTQQSGQKQIRQVSTIQSVNETLTQGNPTGTSNRSINFEFSSISTPPTYDGISALPVGTSFQAIDQPGKPTLAFLSGNLCLSSQANKPCNALEGESIYFNKPLGWTISGNIDSMTVKAGIFSNISVVTQSEPYILPEYTDIGCLQTGSAGCLVSPTSAQTTSSTSWVAEGVGVIKYEGPFYIIGGRISYELKKMPVSRG